MVLQKRTCLIILFLLALVSASAFQIIHTSKIENLYPIQFSMKGFGYKYAYVNQAAQLVVEPQFDYAKEFSEGFAPVRVNKKWGFINLKGQISILPQYDTVGESSSPDSDDYEWSSSSFSEGLAGVKLNGKWGFINQSGELVIPYQFDKVQKFTGGVATVQVGGLWGAINPEAKKWIIQPVDKYPIQFFQGIAKLNLISVDESMHLIGDPNIYWDKSGRLVGDFNNPPKLANEFQEELAIIEVRSWAKLRGLDVPPVVSTSEYGFLSSGGSKCGFQDKQGKVVIEPQFDGCQSFSEGLAAVRVGEKWSYIDKTGKFIVNPQFDYADRFVEERGLVVSNGKIGFIDRTGKVVIKTEFDPIDTGESLRSKIKKYAEQIEPREVVQHQFSNGLAVVAKENKCGYIDKTGKFVIQPKFIRCERFDKYGVAKITQHNEYDYLYINREGKIFPTMISSPASISNFYPARIKLLISVMAGLLSIVAISCHEFGHAIVAYWGGDCSVKDKGYLSFNPLRYINPLHRYINPLHSIILPAFFLGIGGIPLPGAAVYIEFNAIRNRWWSSATAAAGPLSSILFGLLLVPVFHFSQTGNFPLWFSVFIAIFINLQLVIGLFNLLPIPPLDGYRIFSVWFPPKLQERNDIASINGIYFIYFVYLFIPTAIFPILDSADNFMLAFKIPEEFILGGWYLLERRYMVLPLLVAGLVYLIYKPDVLGANQEALLALSQDMDESGNKV